MLEFLGGFLVIYLIVGAILAAVTYADVKDRADSKGIDRWFAYVQHCIMWLPWAIMANKGR